MKRHLSVREGYARKSQNFKPLPSSSCSEGNTSKNQKIEWLVTPISWAKVTGLTGLVALICLLPNTIVHAQRASIKQENYDIPPGGVIIGDEIPEWFWEVSFKAINHPEHLEFVKLSEFRDKLLVIDFWATWCKPCVESVDKWEELQTEFEDEVAVLALHAFDFEEKAKPFAKKRGWTIPVVVGSADSIINRLFYTRYRFGQVWIKDDKLIAIPLSREVIRENVQRTVENLPTELKMNSNHTYFDSRLTLSNGESNENN